MRVLKSEQVVINRNESNFDKACDEAYRCTCDMMGLVTPTFEGWARSSCFIRVVFERYEHTGSMGGHEHKYVFRGEAVRGQG